MIVYEPIDLNDSSFVKYSKFLSSIFTKTTPKSIEYLKWEYLQNPMGEAMGYNAFFENKIVGHYVAQPIKSVIHGQEQKGLFALHVAVHPDMRGKGVFAEINSRTHSYAKDNGFKFIIGVANSNSTYVYTKKLNFSLISSLDTRFGFGTPAISKGISREVDYSRIWSEDSINWRLSNPNNSYYLKKSSKGTFILGKTGKPWLFCVLSFFPSHLSLQFPPNIKELKTQVPIVWYGRNNDFKWSTFKHFSIPQRFKPSPLNMIYLDLTGNNKVLHPSDIFFNPIDHDAF